MKWGQAANVKAESCSRKGWIVSAVPKFENPSDTGTRPGTCALEPQALVEGVLKFGLPPYPQSSSIFLGSFHEINHPAVGATPDTSGTSRQVTHTSTGEVHNLDLQARLRLNEAKSYGFLEIWNIVT